MGLDIYAGTLTRYYSGDWKSKAQQIAEANGLQFRRINVDGSDDAPVDDEAEVMRIRDIMCQWMGDISAGLDSVGKSHPHPLWQEDKECDYFTDKPDWEAFGALVMLIACRLQNASLPEYVEKGWNAFEEPVVQVCQSQERSVSLLSEVTLWLPIAENDIYETGLPNGENGLVSTLSLLKHELDEINRNIWKADEPTILSWSDDKYYVPVKPKNFKSLFGFLNKKNDVEKFRTEDLAQCAYSILYRALNFAIEHKVPLLLDI